MRRPLVVTSAALLALAALGSPGAAAPVSAGAICIVLGSDFDHDENADVAIGEPGRDVGASLSAGAVKVLYGTDTGLTSTGNQTFTQATAGLGTTASSEEAFGHAITSGDFDDDCYADLAVLAPGDGTHGLVIIYGSASGLTTTGSQRFSVPGSAIASGDFDGDGADDLAIGGSNIVSVLKGGVAGMSFVGTLDQDSTGVPGVDEAGDDFGDALASADFDGDDLDDLAIGAPGEDVGGSASKTDAGSVTILYGDADAVLTATDAQVLTQDSPGISGTAEHDQFGAALAAGEFDNTEWNDLVVGSPQESIGADERTGMIHVVDGTPGGLDGAQSKAFSQDTSGVPGANEDLDHFGAALAVGEFSGEGYEDIAIGTRDEDVGAARNAGSVTILYSNGEDGGIVTTGSEAFSQDTSGVLGTSEINDYFGQSLHTATVTGAGLNDLLVGAPGEDTGAFTNDGMIHLLRASAASNGITVAGDQTWTSESINGTGETNASFGRSIH